jgi:hypothetical protein
MKRLKEMAGGHGERVSYKGLTRPKPKRWDVSHWKGLVCCHVVLGTLHGEAR